MNVDTRKINYLMIMSWMLFIIFACVFGMAYYILFWEVNPLTFHGPMKIMTDPVVAGKTLEYSQDRTKHLSVPAAVSRGLWCKVPGDGVKRYTLDNEPYPSNLPATYESDFRNDVDIPREAGGQICKIIWTAIFRIDALKTATVTNESGWFTVEGGTIEKGEKGDKGDKGER